jgi:hypothetical protein
MSNGDYFKLSFIMAEVGNLDAKLEDYFMYFFYNGRGVYFSINYNRSDEYYVQW